IRAATTCATDVKMFRRGHRALGPFPARLGHEFAGEVVAVGEGVTAWSPGELAFCADSAPCRSCRPCRRGLQNLCENLRYPLGGTVTFVGGCAHDAMLEVPARRLHYEEVTLRGSYHHTPGHIARALDMLTQASIPWDDLVGPAIGLDALPALLAAGRPSCTG